MTSSWLTFNPVFPLWAIALLTLPIFAFFIWREIKRPHKFLLARIIAQLLVLISILGLLIQPSYREQQTESSILLLTPSYDKLKVDSLLKVNSSFKIIRMKEAKTYANSEVLTSYHNLAKIGRDIKIVTGQGLPEYALELLKQKDFKFIPAPFPHGVTELSIPKQTVVNKRSTVKGIFNAFGKTKLKLIGPAGGEDSVTFNSSGQFPFDLSFKPKLSGLFLYELSIQDGASTTLEKLPLEVMPEQKQKILILEKFPTAEVRYLKNYLTEKGHSLALRHQISKTDFKYEFANLNSTRIDRLTPEVGETFDLIFIDDKVLAEFSASEKNYLESAVQNGLGVVILSDDFSEKDKTFKRLLPIKTKQLATDTIQLRLGHSKLYTIPFVPVEIAPNASIQPILQHKGRVLSGYLYSGAGKVGFQLLTETYRISLEGNEDDYAFIWSDLIERTARSKNEMFKISLVNDFPYYSDEPLTLDIISSGTQPSLYENNNSIPLEEDVIIDDYWHGKSWAGKPGWNKLITQDSTQFNYFVSNENEWRSLRLVNQIKANMLVQSSDSGTNDSIQFIHQPIPILIFFLIFLFASGFLWLAPKI